MLESLERANLFLVPLDDRRRWYRYHHLFADLLRARLLDQHPDDVPELHRRASAWWEAHGEPAEAIGHALAAGDVEHAADLIEGRGARPAPPSAGRHAAALARRPARSCLRRATRPRGRACGVPPGHRADAGRGPAPHPGRALDARRSVTPRPWRPRWRPACRRRTPRRSDVCRPASRSTGRGWPGCRATWPAPPGTHARRSSSRATSRWRPAVRPPSSASRHWTTGDLVAAHAAWSEAIAALEHGGSSRRRAGLLDLAGRHRDRPGASARREADVRAGPATLSGSRRARPPGMRGHARRPRRAVPRVERPGGRPRPSRRGRRAGRGDGPAAAPVPVAGGARRVSCVCRATATAPARCWTRRSASTTATSRPTSAPSPRPAPGCGLRPAATRTPSPGRASAACRPTTSPSTCTSTSTSRWRERCWPRPRPPAAGPGRKRRSRFLGRLLASAEAGGRGRSRGRAARPARSRAPGGR